METAEYLSQIESFFHFCRGQRGLLSPEDFRLMKTWRQAGIPLRAVLQGIADTFDEWHRDRKWPRRINGLSFCTANVLKEAERMKEAAVGSHANE